MFPGCLVGPYDFHRYANITGRVGAPRSGCDTTCVRTGRRGGARALETEFLHQVIYLPVYCSLYLRSKENAGHGLGSFLLCLESLSSCSLFPIILFHMFASFPSILTRLNSDPASPSKYLLPHSYYVLALIFVCEKKSCFSPLADSPTRRIELSSATN